MDNSEWNECKEMLVARDCPQSNYLYSRMIDNNPFFDHSLVTEFKAIDNDRLLLTYKDGLVREYDTLTNTFRNIKTKNRKHVDEEVRMKFRQHLDRSMMRAGMSQQDLAIAIGTSQQMISRYLTGDSIPTIITIKKLADVLKCSVDDFYL